MNGFAPPPQPVDELIGFRVECHSGNSLYINVHRMNNNGSISPHALPNKSLFWRHADDHLSWKHKDTPFLSFFRSWKRVMDWREKRITGGTKQVRIIAVFLKGLPHVYNAYEVARLLGYPSYPNPQPGIRRRLENHLDELLVHDGIGGCSYRVLACFEGDTLNTENISLSPLVNDQIVNGERFLFDTTIPRGSLWTVSDNTTTERLMDEIHRCTGAPDDFKLCALVLRMCGRYLDHKDGSDGIMRVWAMLRFHSDIIGIQTGEVTISFVL